MHAACVSAFTFKRWLFLSPSLSFSLFFLSISTSLSLPLCRLSLSLPFSFFSVLLSFLLSPSNSIPYWLFQMRALSKFRFDLLSRALRQFAYQQLPRRDTLFDDNTPVWPDWVIYWTLGNFLKPLATTNLFKSLTFLGYYCKGVKIYHFFTEIILGNFYRHLAIFSGHTVCEMSGWWLVSFTFLCWPIIIQGPIP